MNYNSGGADAAVSYHIAPRALTDSGTTPQGNATQILGNVAGFQRDQSPIIVNHYDIEPVYDIYANVDQRDLGGVAHDIEKIIEHQKVSKATQLELRGQVDTMNDSFTRLGFGIIFAMGLVYLLMAVNFQSWLGSTDHLDGDSVCVLPAFCGRSS